MGSISVPSAADRTISLLAKFSQSEGQRRARHVTRKGVESDWNRGGMWHSGLFYGCTANAGDCRHQSSQGGAEGQSP